LACFSQAAAGEEQRSHTHKEETKEHHRYQGNMRGYIYMDFFFGKVSLSLHFLHLVAFMTGYGSKRGRKFSRIGAVMAGVCLFAAAIVVRLGYLQLYRHQEFRAFAASQQVSTSIDPATRGRIFLQANKGGEPAIAAENVTLFQMYFDPNPYNERDLDALIDTAYVAQKLAPVLYSHFCGEGAISAMTSEEDCEENITGYTGKPVEKLASSGTEKRSATGALLTEEDPAAPKLSEAQQIEEARTNRSARIVKKTDEEILQDILLATQQKISQKEVVFVPLLYEKDPTVLTMYREKYALPGIYVGDGIVYGNPLEALHDAEGGLPKDYEPLAKELGLSFVDLSQKMTRRLSRYALLTRRITPELRKVLDDYILTETKCPQLYKQPEKIEGLVDPTTEICQKLRRAPNGKVVKNFYGLALREENWRNYPEESIAAQIIGFLNFDKDGNYGIEEEFDNVLRGADGEMKIESDPRGRLIASNLKSDQIKDRLDGVDIYLTIDRVVQEKVQDLLAAKVQSTRANSGVAIVMNPFTGEIIAMAQYPSFDPNAYADAYEMVPTASDPGRGIPMFIKNDKGEFVAVPEAERGKIPRGVEKFMYKNRVGPAAFMNMAVQSTYEPGSIFKPLIMAAGIDSGEITPNTTYRDTGELKVDEFTIRNVSKECLGTKNMVNVLNYSCNIGMSFIAQKLGKALLHKYILDFGFSERTDIELPNEAKGLVFPYEEWSAARQFNAAFGQGLTVTPLQMAQSFSALANGGVLISPRIIKKIVYKQTGREVVPGKQEERRVIAKDTANTVMAMLTSVVEVGGSKNAKIDGFFVGGKTGTAQIASSSGGYEEGIAGNTIGSFAGVLPADKPQFVIITKIDRPRTSQWADQTAAPLFKEIGEFLVEYYTIPPDRK